MPKGRNNLKNKVLSSRNKKVKIALGDFFIKICNLGYLPRWIVFSIDATILLVAGFLKYLLVYNLNPFAYSTLDVYSRYSIEIGVNLFFFLVFRTYSGIIRHSSFIDGVRLLLAVFSSLVVLMTVNLGAEL